MVNPRTFISLIRGIVSGTSNSALDSQLQSSVTEVLSTLGNSATTTYVTQTGNYVLPDYVATTDNVSQDYVITGSNNGAHTITVPTTMVNGLSKWQNGNGILPESTKLNYIYTQTKNGYIIFNTIKTSLPIAPDLTAPTLSSPMASSTGSVTATIGVTTNEANGTLYAVMSTSATPPTPTQVELGQNNGGSAAVFATNQAITTTGAKTFSATGLTANTTYYTYFMHKDAAGNQSTVSAALSITTSAFAFNTKSISQTTNNVLSSTANPTNLSFATGPGGTDSPFSISAWVYQTVTGAGQLVSLTHVSNLNDYQYLTSIGTTAIAFYMWSGAVYLGRYSNVGLALNVWSHVVITYSGNKTNAGQKIYINGVLQSLLNDNAGTYTGATAINSNYKLSVAGTTQSSDKYNKGLIDEISIINKELSLTEITEIYNVGVANNLLTSSITSNVKSYYRFEDNLNDSGTNAYNLTQTITPVYSTTRP